MVVLHITICDEPDGQKIQVDRLLREDATALEQASANSIHDYLQKGFEDSPSRRGPVEVIGRKREP